MEAKPCILVGSLLPWQVINIKGSAVVSLVNKKEGRWSFSICFGFSRFFFPGLGFFSIICGHLSRFGKCRHAEKRMVKDLTRLVSGSLPSQRAVICILLLIITITIFWNLIGVLTALFFTNCCVGLKSDNEIAQLAVIEYQKSDSYISQSY